MNIINEVWKDISDYEGFYQVSSQGRVKSIDRIVGSNSRKKALRSTILKPALSTSGYLCVSLWKDNKGATKSIHGLVALAFLGVCPDGCNVNHKDGNKLNNHIENLEYCTFAQNSQHAYNAGIPKVARGEKHGFSKLKNSDIIAIRDRIALGHKNTVIAKDFNVDASAISRIKTGRNWSHTK
jgi:hypothetical protein